MLELKSIFKAYNGKAVLHGISCQFIEGKIYVIKGVSGCGKTTLLNIIGGLDTDYKGEYVCDGSSVSTYNNKELDTYRQSIGYMFQSSLLLAKLTVLENLMFIKNDEQAIMYYAQKLSIEPLLQKYPEQLSGGERQRIAIMRCLLNNPKLILADEPTASLDAANSKRISDLFAQISNNSNIIIIVTHENCFDKIADEIINLNYGQIESSQPKSRLNRTSVQTYEYSPETKKPIESIKYAFKRSKEKYKPSKLWVSALIVLILLSCVSVRLNFKREYMNYVYKKYPVNVFNIGADDYKKLKKSYNFVVYKNYTIQQNGMTCFPLLDEKDSGISYAHAIEYGHFPVKGSEVIVTKEFIKNILKTNEYKSCIGKQIMIGGCPYSVAGILADLKPDKDDSTAKKTSISNMYDIVYYNVYYNSDAHNAVFIPYQTISKRGHEIYSDEFVVKLELRNSPELQKTLRTDLGGAFSQWDEKIMNAQSAVNTIFIIILIAICIIAIVALLFMKNEIQLELFYRRREIGYLQVFNVKKSQIRFSLISERVLRTAFAILYGLLLFTICLVVVYVSFGINGIVHLYILISFVLILLVYSTVVAWLPCRKFLKKSIISLIRSC